MKTKVLLIASAVILASGAALHLSSAHECPFGKPCQQLKSEKAVKVVKAETATIAKK
jgi:hypothetical protein